MGFNQSNLQSKLRCAESWECSLVGSSLKCSLFHILITGLKIFSKTAIEFSKGESVRDVVKSYLASSSNGQDIFDLLEDSKYSPSEVIPKFVFLFIIFWNSYYNCTILFQYATIFEFLEVIFLRLSGDDEDVAQFKGTSLAIVRRFIQSGMRNIYFLFSGKNKSNHIKSGLKLLTSMVALSTQSAREVVAVFDFANKCFPSLLNRRDIKVSCSC